MTRHISRDVNFPPRYILWFVENIIEAVMENDLKHNEILTLDLIHDKYTNDPDLVEAVKRVMGVNGYDVKLSRYKERDKDNEYMNLFTMKIQYKYSLW